METKYYQPTFEDFIPGLEYEYFDGMKWTKKTYNSLSHRADGSMSLMHDLILRKERFRVKYLDKQDGIELGLSYLDYEEKDLLYYGFTKRVAAVDYVINIPVADFDSDIEIASDEGDVFIGRVKNKTELKRILKHIGLWEK